MRTISKWAAGGVIAVALAVVGFGLVSGGEASAGKDHPVVAEMQAMMADANAQLEAAGAGYRVLQVELLTTDPQSPNIVLAASFGNKQLPHDFVAGDARRPWSPSSVPGAPGISYVVDVVDATAPGPVLPAATELAIDTASKTWDAGTPSTNVPLVKFAPVPFDVGVIEFFFSGGVDGSPFVVADIQHGGWQPPGFFPPPVLAATFTYIFCAPPPVGCPTLTDIDANGKVDTAFREIYYNAFHLWAINAGPGPGAPFDVETVALHELGHGLSQAHFGKVILNTRTGTLRAIPLAVMNAVYLGQQQTLLGTDIGGHSSIWGNWPVR